MTGYAVRKDLTGWRAVDSNVFDALNPSGTYPDPDTEMYSEKEPPPPVQPPPTEEQIFALRDSLLSIAALRIAPLQDAVDLGVSSDLDRKNLELWRHYRISVNRVQEQVGFPSSVDWPIMPTYKGE